jgi:putative PIN family toxin of toxin-antitoxin system
MTIRAVMDTNVLVAALRSEGGASFQLLRLCRQERWKLVLSNTVATEYEEILRREAAWLYLAPEDVDKLLDALCLLAERRTLPERPLPVLSDPDDEPLVHLAVEAGVRYLVTHNVRHLAPARQHGIEVVTPAEFLSIVKRAI